MLNEEKKEKTMVCPRCQSDAAALIAHSPLRGKWEMYNCRTCGYSWRNTDVLANRSPEHFPVNFRIDRAKIDTFVQYPPIAAKK